MTKHIGIVGCSAEGAALCYRTICAESEVRMGEHNHPEVSMHTFPLGDYTPLFPANDWNGVGDLMARSARKLAAIGADFAISPDNTIHQAFEQAVQGSPIPWLHIAVEVAKEAQERGYAKLGITGTNFLMTGPVYPRALDRLGIAYEIPGEHDRERINETIFGELVKGVFSDESKTYFNSVFDTLRKQGCDAVIMGCTEIPLLMDGVETSAPTLDSTRILARAAIDYALES
jgi:aspartate racemase